MAVAEELQTTGSSTKRVIKFAPAIGDWTVLRPQKTQPKKIRRGLYHFDRLSAEELHQAHLLHYTLVDRLLREWRESLLLGSELYSISADQVSYLDFLEGIVSPAVQCNIQLGEKNENGAMYMDLHIAQALIHRALGFRDGISLSARNLTDNEIKILRTIFDSHGSAVEHAFASSQKPKFDVASTLTFTPDTTINAMSTYVVFEAEVTLGGSGAGKIGFGYLATSLKQVMEKINAKEKNMRQKIWLPGTLLESLSASVAAVLGSTSITAAELKKMEPGDVLVLDQEVNDPLAILIAGREVLTGTPGIVNGKFAVRCYQKSPAGSAGVEIEEPTITTIPEPADEAALSPEEFEADVERGENLEDFEEGEEDLENEFEDEGEEKTGQGDEEENPFKF